jgi:hypothetical protein
MWDSRPRLCFERSSRIFSSPLRNWLSSRNETHFHQPRSTVKLAYVTLSFAVFDIYLQRRTMGAAGFPEALSAITILYL